MKGGSCMMGKGMDCEGKGSVGAGFGTKYIWSGGA